MRIAAYVDGFNLYYRALENSRFKWLNIHKLCEGFLEDGQTLEFTKYFTARLAAAQFSEVVMGLHGKEIRKPSTW